MKGRLAPNLHPLLVLLLLVLGARHVALAGPNWMYLGLVGVPPPLQQEPSSSATATAMVSGGPGAAGGGVSGASSGVTSLDEDLDDADMAEARAVCSALPGLVTQQTVMCLQQPSAIQVVADGARLAISECQHQFRTERWNCSASERDQSVFGYILDRGSKETAFIYAVMSAGVAHAVTLACSAGNLTDCSCDPTHGDGVTPEGWKWGGCSDNLQYGLQFARRFVDAPDRVPAVTPARAKQKQRSSNRVRMNLHNNEAGRQVVGQLLRMHCRCHGVSGSCQLKTCWRTLPPFSEVGDLLKRKYREAVQLPGQRSRRRQRRKIKGSSADSTGVGVAMAQMDSTVSPETRPGRRARKWRRSAAKADLVHIHRSPDYCVLDPRRGIPGTAGRACNKTAGAPDSCDLLCCGRGYNTQVVKQVERCHCKFIWCCYVTCKTCETTMDRHTCK